jgi:hypothetical protein
MQQQKGRASIQEQSGLPPCFLKKMQTPSFFGNGNALMCLSSQQLPQRLHLPSLTTQDASCLLTAINSMP